MGMNNLMNLNTAYRLISNKVSQRDSDDHVLEKGFIGYVHKEQFRIS